VVSLVIGLPCWAFCPFSDTLMKTLNETSVLNLYKSCAEGRNDDASQARLAAIYDKGTPTIRRDMKKALYYYQLSSDNGNAESQARLAQLYMELDRDREGRKILHEYLNSVIPMSAGEDSDDFKGELIHPYVLLMIANEKVANKWYYPTQVKQAPAYAINLFKNYKIDEAKKKQLMREATVWKKRKLLEMARQILSPEEYREFVLTLYPENGMVDNFKRNQLLKSFQEKVLLKQQGDQQSAKAFY